MSAISGYGSPSSLRRASMREEARADRQAAREADRADRVAEAEQRREDQRAAQQRKADARAARVAARDQRSARRRDVRRQRWVALRGAVSEHVPVAALPVVAVSLATGWGGQAQAAAALGMGGYAVGLPVLTEGMTLTLAGLTATAIAQHRPYRGLLVATWATGVFAALVNAIGHLVEDSSVAGMYRAGMFAFASTAALILWTVVMATKKAAASGASAQGAARWRRLRRRHPLLARRARHIADATGTDVHDAFARVWKGIHGAGPHEPTIPEIRRSRRAVHRRTQAEAWDGQRRWSRRTPTSESEAAHSALSDLRKDESVEGGAGVSASTQASEPAPHLPNGLLLPAGDGTWTRHPIRAHSHPVSPTAKSVSGAGHSSARPGTDKGTPGSEDPRRETVRQLVWDAVASGADLTRTPSLRATARQVGCRPSKARQLLTDVLAEHGITR